jgi:hypothetical protein
MFKLSVLVSLRSQIKVQLTRLAKYLQDNSGDDIDIDRIKIRAEKSEVNTGKVPEGANADRRRGRR